MRVFVLCTGRSGSTTFIKACEHIENFSCGHETRAEKVNEARLDYPKFHIEADNRLSWMLGKVDDKFGDDAIYVHLIRNKEETVNSFNKRWGGKVSMIKAYAEGILMRPKKKLTKIEKKEICEDYYDTVNQNIKSFLKDKSRTMTVQLENIQSDFQKFWEFIEAKGNLQLALQELEVTHNESR